MKNDELIDTVYKSLEKSIGDRQPIYRLSDELSPVDVKKFVSTGCAPLDVALANRKNGGFAVGRLSQIQGKKSCVTEDTLVEIVAENKPIKIGEIKSLLEQGKKVRIKSRNNKYRNVTDFIEKGKLDVYKIILEDNYSSIKVTNEHIFYSDEGWLMLKFFDLDNNKILCKDGKYRKIINKEFLGKRKIVDVGVEKTHCYFGNKMLNHNTGKSLLLATALANAQKQGYITALFDNEYAVDESFYKAIGLDTEKLIYGNIEYVEDVLMAIEDIIMNISKSKNDTPVVIGIDSIAGLKSKEDIETDYDKGGYHTHKAIILSQKLPKILPLLAKHKVALICTQQLRANVGVTFGPSTVPASGGKAIGYFTSQIVKLRSAGKIKSKDKLIVGTKIKAQVTKNRLGPPYRTAEFEIYFDSGIDDHKSCLDILSTYNVVKGRGWKYFTEDLGIDGIDLEEEKEGVYGPKFRTKRWREWLSNPDTYEAIVEKIAELNIMKYKGHMEDDDTQIVTDKEDEEQMDEDSKKQVDDSK